MTIHLIQLRSQLVKILVVLYERILFPLSAVWEKNNCKVQNNSHRHKGWIDKSALVDIWRNTTIWAKLFKHCVRIILRVYFKNTLFDQKEQNYYASQFLYSRFPNFIFWFDVDHLFGVFPSNARTSSVGNTFLTG